MSSVYRINLGILWTTVLLFLPPSITALRNPPPQNLVDHWWIRFLLSIGLLAFNSYALYARREVASVRRWFYYPSSVIAVYIAVHLLVWVSEFPCLFGIPYELLVR